MISTQEREKNEHWSFLRRCGRSNLGKRNPTIFTIKTAAGYRDFEAGAWECVTGRVNQGESYEQALHREVMEEISASVQIEFIIATTHFFRGEAIADNELLGVIYGCSIDDAASVRIDSEHSEMRWVSTEEAIVLLADGHWLREVIRRAELLKTHLPVKLRHEFRHHGFEI